MTTLTVIIPLEVTDEHCADIMCTALEGGIGYWAQARNIQRRLVNPKPGYSLDMDCWYESCEIAELNDDESGYDWRHPKKLTYATIRRGIKRVCEDQRFSHLREGVINDIRDDEMGCYIDADVADCIVQIGLFNEIRYG